MKTVNLTAGSVAPDCTAPSPDEMKRREEADKAAAQPIEAPKAEPKAEKKK